MVASSPPLSEPETAGPRRLWTRAFVSLLLAQAGFGYAFSSFLLLPTFITSELGGGPETIGRVTAVSGLAVVVFLLLAGVCVDRFGRRRFLLTGALLMAAASLGFAAVERVDALLYALRIVQCLAFAFAFAAGSALCVDEAPPERLGQALGVLGLTFVAMGAVGPGVVEALSRSAGWDVAFGVAAAGAAVGAVLSLAIRERPRPRRGGNTTPLLRLLARSDQRRAGAVVALVGMAMGAVFNFHQPYALGLGLTGVSHFFVAHTAAALFVRLGLGPYLEGLGRRRVVLVSLMLYALVACGMTELARLGLVVLGLGMGLAHGVFYPMYSALVVAGIADEERGRVLAILQAWFNAGVALGGLGLGELASRAGYPAIFAVAAAGLVLATALVGLGNRTGDAGARGNAGARAPDRIASRGARVV